MLRVGIGQQVEFQQFVQNETIEALAKVQDDGRFKPLLAKEWSTADQGTQITLTLRDDVRFHDGTLMDAEVVAGVLKQTLPKTMGSFFDDVSDISVGDAHTVRIALKDRSSFVLDAVLEAQITKSSEGRSIGTGPFVERNGDGKTEMVANTVYYLGRPSIDRIVVQTYPSTRSAWAELLRNNVDMLYQAGVESLDSLESASTSRIFSFVRRYQYGILLNPHRPALASASIRRALNTVVDRSAVTKEALPGRAVPSDGPVWPKNWAFNAEATSGALSIESAAQILKGRSVTFTCLATADEERLALAVKQQLERFGVDMVVQEASLADLNKASETRDFDAILAPMISGPTLFRPYLWWHSQGPFNRTGYSDAAVDRALDSLRRAKSNDDYREGVASFERSVAANPPAIFLAWDEVTRAVSNRFDVPAEEGVDILGALRLWRPVASPSGADKN